LAPIGLEFIVQGPDGNTGPTGLEGASGPTGAEGDTGPTGLEGLSGPTGLEGASGPTGLEGLSGPTGLEGASGPTGLEGASGPTGLEGLSGPTGLEGASGPTGAEGDTGPTGLEGLSGPTGLEGLSGPTGDTGSDATVNFTNVNAALATADADIDVNAQSIINLGKLTQTGGDLELIAGADIFLDSVNVNIGGSLGVSGTLDMTEGLIKNIDVLEFEGRVYHQGDPLVGAAFLYQSSTLGRLMYKNATGIGQKVMLDLVDDTTPTLGGDLDLNGKKLETNLATGTGIYLDTTAVVNTILTLRSVNEGTGKGVIDLDSTTITGGCIDTDVTFASSVDTKLASQLAIKTYADTKSIGWHGSETRVKIMPSDFIKNGDWSRGNLTMSPPTTVKPVAFSTDNDNLEAFACVVIPQGYKATKFILKGNDSLNKVYAWEGCVFGCNAIELFDYEWGSAGAEIYVVNTEYTFDTELTAGDYNYLLVWWESEDGAGYGIDLLYGGWVTIEAV